VSILRLLAIFVFLGCFGLTCHSPSSTTSPQYEVDRIPRLHQFSAQAYYLDVLRTVYKDQIKERGVDLLAVETRVYWSKSICPLSGRIGLFYDPPDEKPGCYRGLTWSCTEIYVSDHIISESAFIHELGHCYHQYIYENRDSDHKTKPFWKLVDRVDSDLAKRGW